MIARRSSNSNKLVLSSLAISAILLVGRVTIPAKVEAIGDPYQWSQLTDAAYLGGSIYGSSSAISSNGSHLAFGVWGGNSPLYISRNYGVTWEDVANIAEPGVINNWFSVDMSNDGQTMVAASYSSDGDGTGEVFVSEDSGNTWQNITPGSANMWINVSIAGESGEIVALAGDDPGNVYITSNNGSSWTTSPIENIASWKSLSVSEDGGDILIGGENSLGALSSVVYISNDGGASWQNITPPDARDGTYASTKVDISSDGNKLIVGTLAYDGDSGAYNTVHFSDNAGVSWTDITPVDEKANHRWDVAISGNGTVLAAADYDYPGSVFVSDDSGSSWNEENPGLDFGDTSLDWSNIVINDNGSRVGVVDGLFAYMGYNAGLDFDTTFISNAEDGKAIKMTTQSGTTFICSTAEKESDHTDDVYYSYPLGLVNFCLGGVDGSAEVTLLFVTDLTPNEVTLRKYNSVSGTYSTISGATISETTYGGLHALLISYSIIDNGPLDLDPTLSLITDPVGLGVAEIGAPNTGLQNQGGRATQASTVILMSAGLALISILIRIISVRK